MEEAKNNNFDSDAGAFDSVEGGKVLGIFIMWRLRYLFDISNTVIDMHNGLILMREKNPRQSKKKLEIFFNEHIIKITSDQWQGHSLCRYNFGFKFQQVQEVSTLR